MAVVCEKSFEIYAKLTVLVLFEAYLKQKRLVGDLTYVFCGVYVAKIDKVECAASHNEQSLTRVKVRRGCDIVYHAALVRELELANSRQTVVDVCRVCKQIGIVIY